MDYDEIKQQIKGDNNNTKITINYNNGITIDNAVAIIQSFGYVNKEEVINIFRELFNQIPEGNRVTPDKRVFVPTIQQLSYSLDDDLLRESYENLLKASMDKTKINSIHPSFVNILGQLNSDEIKLLNTLPVTPLASHPCIDVRIVGNGQSGIGVKYFSNFTNIGEGVCECPDNVGIYLENLERLKIIEIPFDVYISDNTKYDPLINHPKIKTLSAMLDASKNGSIRTDKKLFKLTSFGETFIRCCTSKSKK